MAKPLESVGAKATDHGEVVLRVASDDYLISVEQARRLFRDLRHAADVAEDLGHRQARKGADDGTAA